MVWWMLLCTELDTFCCSATCYLQIWCWGAIIGLRLLHLNLKSPIWQISYDPLSYSNNTVQCLVFRTNWLKMCNLVTSWNSTLAAIVLSWLFTYMECKNQCGCAVRNAINKETVVAWISNLSEIERLSIHLWISTNPQLHGAVLISINLNQNWEIGGSPGAVRLPRAMGIGAYD